MANYEALQFAFENQVAWVTLNRPDARNAINDAMRDELFAVLGEARANPDIRAVVITGAGKGFCTGADLSRRGDGPTGPGAAREMMRTRSQRLIRSIWELEKPVIAAVNGVAAGLGAHLAFASDLIIAAAEARFIEVFVRRGIAVDAGGAFLLPRLIGLAKAKELVFFGEDLSAEDALQICCEELREASGMSGAGSEHIEHCRAVREYMLQHPTWSLAFTRALEDYRRTAAVALEANVARAAAA